MDSLEYFETISGIPKDQIFMIRGRFCRIIVTELRELFVIPIKDNEIKDIMQVRYPSFRNLIYRTRNFYNYPTLTFDSTYFTYKSKVLRIKEYYAKWSKDKVVKSLHSFRSMPNFANCSFNVYLPIRKKELNFNGVLDGFFESIKKNADNKLFKNFLSAYLFEDRTGQDKPIINITGSEKEILINIIKEIQPEEFCQITDKGNFDKGFKQYKGLYYLGNNIKDFIELSKDQSVNRNNYSNIIISDKGYKGTCINFELNKKDIKDLIEICRMFGFQIKDFLDLSLGFYSENLYDFYLKNKLT